MGKNQIKDNDEKLAKLLENNGYTVTRGSKETLKAIAKTGRKR